MKKLINIALASTVVMLLSTGCGNSKTKAVDDTTSVGTELTLQNHTTSKKLHEAIIKAGSTSSATVTFSKEQVVITNESGNFDANGLLAAIEAELTNEEIH
jgi:hypothetical protein